MSRWFKLENEDCYIDLDEIVALQVEELGPVAFMKNVNQRVYLTDQDYSDLLWILGLKNE